jgi:multiple sugar transport system permease protein
VSSLPASRGPSPGPPADRGPSRGAPLTVVHARARATSWWRTPTARRYLFGYTLLAPAVAYVALLVGVPFLFSLYLSVSDASVGVPVARFVGLENFRAVMESGTYWLAVRNTLLFTVGAGILKGLLGTTLAFLLIQTFKGRRVIRGLIVIPFTLPIAVSVLGWKWMFDSQFSVFNWALSQLGLIGGYGSSSWPVWLGQPGLALLSVMFVNVWRGFPFGAIVLLAGMTSVPPEILDAARVDGASFLARFRKIIVPMIAPILFIGSAFDTVFTLSDLSIVYLLTNGGPDGATEILPTLAYNTGIQAGALGRGAAISLSLFPLLLPLMILLLRTLRRREY